MNNANLVTTGKTLKSSRENAYSGFSSQWQLNFIFNSLNEPAL